MSLEEQVDLVVVGGGIGGLATAALAQARGLRVALCESHTKLGGCAGYFGRGPYHFDAGATALMGLQPGEPIGDLLATIGVDFESMQTPAYRVCLPDRDLNITPDSAQFLREFAKVFPGEDSAKAFFWNLQETVGSRLFAVASRVPRLPARSVGDLAHDLRILGVRGLLAASTWLLTVENVLQILHLNRDRPFRSLIAMLLQDTAQAGPETGSIRQRRRVSASLPDGDEPSARWHESPGRRDRPEVRRDGGRPPNRDEGGLG